MSSSNQNLGRMLTYKISTYLLLQYITIWNVQVSFHTLHTFIMHFFCSFVCVVNACLCHWNTWVTNIFCNYPTLGGHQHEFKAEVLHTFFQKYCLHFRKKKYELTQSMYPTEHYFNIFRLKRRNLFCSKYILNKHCRMFQSIIYECILMKILSILIVYNCLGLRLEEYFISPRSEWSFLLKCSFLFQQSIIDILRLFWSS